MNWKPCASIETLGARAEILISIRNFFNSRGFLEVETPLLCKTSVTDPFIQSIPALANHYLQTSPEYAMKRLLAANSGPIFQICKAFRRDELGRFHNPEFTMIEWYRPGFDHHELMNETDELLQLVLKKPAAQRKSYADIFIEYLNINPHFASLAELQALAREKNISVAAEISEPDTWLQLLMSEYIEPRIGQDRPCFIYDFPVSQAALARISPGNPQTASRFEVYYRGVELANGFHELQDADEQRKRFEKNREMRKELQLNDMKIDEFLLAALSHGLPDCAGVALGIDRLIMLALDADCISNVISFDFSKV